MATVTGAVFGTSTTTSYIESTAGVAAGARTGFASIVTGVLFLCTVLLTTAVCDYGGSNCTSVNYCRCADGIFIREY